MGIGIIQGNMRGMGILEFTYDPSSISAATTEQQTVTVPGVKVGDVVVIIKGSLDSGVAIAGTQVTATDTVKITWVNATAAPVNPPSETYKCLWFRPEGGTSAAISV